MPGRSSSRWWSLAVGCSLLTGCMAVGGGDAELVDEALVDPRGADETLDVANWNVEWLGNSGLGPVDEVLQLANVEDVIRGTDFDVWSLEEVSGVPAFEQLLDALSDYDGVVANDPIVEGGSGSYSSAEQKPALVFKSDVAKLVSARVILPEESFAFGGRPPLEVRLSVTLNGSTEERIYILLHMKAFGDAESRQRRADASAALKAFLDLTFPAEKVTVLGDWNDDLDGSSPFANFVGDSDYSFPTRVLTDDGIGTTCSSSNAIDHQMVTDELAGDRVAGSVEAYDLEDQVGDYCDTTSDHKPVLVRYAFGGKPPAQASVLINEILANEPGSDTGAEFVEIVNAGSSAADLSGWTLRDDTGVRHVFADGTSLAAGQAIAVFAAADAIPAELDNAVAASGGTLSLTNAGEEVSIRDASGSVVDSFAYSSSLTASDGVSMNRDPDAGAGSFVLHSALSPLASSPGRRTSGDPF